MLLYFNLEFLFYYLSFNAGRLGELKIKGNLYSYVIYLIKLSQNKKYIESAITNWTVNIYTGKGQTMIQYNIYTQKKYITTIRYKIKGT